MKEKTFGVRAHRKTSIISPEGLPSGRLADVDQTQSEFEINNDQRLFYFTFTMSILRGPHPVKTS